MTAKSDPARIEIPRFVTTRKGLAERFDRERLRSSIEEAVELVQGDNGAAAAVAAEITNGVLRRLLTTDPDAAPNVVRVASMCVEELRAQGYEAVADRFIELHSADEPIVQSAGIGGRGGKAGLGRNAIEVLRRRYLLRDEQGRAVESPEGMFRRAASAVADAERVYAGSYSPEEVEERFYHLMVQRLFLPNSPTLMNAGTQLGQLSACFVLPVEDSIESIFATLGSMARIHQSGGGTGFDFSPVRPRGDIVRSTRGRASGPVSFMTVFDTATSVVMQGGRRRGANMGILRCDHPDIFEFVNAKRAGTGLTNFNLSVAVTAPFLEAVDAGGRFDLISPRDGTVARRIVARELFDAIAAAAWETGDPGLVFIDRINERNPVPAGGDIQATNPCGEIPLLPYESCNLGTINVASFVRDGGIDWERLRETIRWGIRFLDDVIEVNRYPLPEIERATLANRKVGLGIMGFADMLIQLGISYGSPRAVGWAERLMRFVREESMRASAALAEERGVFPSYQFSVHARHGHPMRNATVNTVAPTGTVSIIAGCSSGIEPLFALSFWRNVLEGTRLLELHPLFRAAIEQAGLDTPQLYRAIAEHGSLQPLHKVPQRLRDLYVTAFDIHPRQHLRIQAAFQHHTDNAVSKTINLPAEATVDEVRGIYREADRLGCKGITVYRYGSRNRQVLTCAHVEEGRDAQPSAVTVDSEYAGGCVGDMCSY